MTTLPFSAAIVNPRPERFVTVVPDGAVYRWQRRVGPGTTLTSREAFLSLASATQAAISVARCYNVPALVPALS